MKDKDALEGLAQSDSPSPDAFVAGAIDGVLESEATKEEGEEDKDGRREENTSSAPPASTLLQLEANVLEKAMADEQTEMSEITLPSSASLFRGPLYQMPMDAPDEAGRLEEHTSSMSPASTLLQLQLESKVLEKAMEDPSEIRKVDTKQEQTKKGNGSTVMNPTEDPTTKRVSENPEEEETIGDGSAGVTNFVEELQQEVQPFPQPQRREHQAWSQSVPGAHALRLVRPPFTRVMESSDPSSPPDLEAPPDPEDPVDSGLVSAYPVEDEVMEVAEQMQGPSPSEEEEEKKIKARQLWYKCIVLLVLLLVGAIAVGSVRLGLSRNKQTSTNDNASVAPSHFPSKAAPSPAPSPVGISVLDGLLETLPELTLESLKQPLSPQSLAYEWLINHRNITHLPEWRKVQLFALATFYYSFEGPSWPEHIQRSWMKDDVEECDWFSSNHGYYNEDGLFIAGELPVYNGLGLFYFCNNATGRVADITLGGLELAGKQPKLPPEVFLLPSLQYLYFPSSEIGGSIDDLIHPHFYDTSWSGNLSLYDNSLTGTITTKFGLLTTLHYLDLSANYLTGTIPTQIAAMTGTASLELYSNHLSGQVPSEIAELDALLVLDIDDNALTGPLPTFISKMTSLESLWLAHSSYTGSIPTQIGLLSRLHTLQLSGNNDLTGEIPSELGMLTDLVRLGLGDLLLSGTLPKELDLCKNLVEVNFNGSSHLSGSVPDGLCSLQDPSCSSYFPYFEEDLDCFLDFECSDHFCGCDCECGSTVMGNHTSGNKTI